MTQDSNQEKLLVTGASGFVGRFVQQATPCAPLSLGGKEVDLRDAQITVAAVEEIQPTAVLHLAAQTFVPKAFDNPLETFEINFFGTYNLLAALKAIGFKGRFLFVSTGDVYGAVPPDSLPIREDMLPRPRNPYSVSKVAAESLCFQWNETGPFETMTARPFNHIGPGQRDNFVVSSFARQIVEIKHGTRTPVIEVGDIEVTRDFCDVRDVVQAYLLLLDQGRAGQTYNICSGMECSVRSLLERMLEIADVDAEIKIDYSKFRPAEQRRVYGDPTKIRRDVGWQLSYAIDTTLEQTIHSWEYQLA